MSDLDTAEAAIAYWNADGYPEAEGQRLQETLARYTTDQEGAVT